MDFFRSMRALLGFRGILNDGRVPLIAGTVVPARDFHCITADLADFRRVSASFSLRSARIRARLHVRTCV